MWCKWRPHAPCRLTRETCRECMLSMADRPCQRCRCNLSRQKSQGSGTWNMVGDWRFRPCRESQRGTTDSHWCLWTDRCLRRRICMWKHLGTRSFLPRMSGRRYRCRVQRFQRHRRCMLSLTSGCRSHSTLWRRSLCNERTSGEGCIRTCCMLPRCWPIGKRSLESLCMRWIQGAMLYWRGSRCRRPPEWRCACCAGIERTVQRRWTRNQELCIRIGATQALILYQR
jgi:hypothetical protein